MLVKHNKSQLCDYMTTEPALPRYRYHKYAGIQANWAEIFPCNGTNRASTFLQFNFASEQNDSPVLNID